jgi:hypothetical protein
MPMESLTDAVEDEVMVEETARVTNGRILTCFEEDGTASRARRLLCFGIARSSVLLPHPVMSMSVLATYHQLIKQQGTTTPLLLVTTGDYIVQYPDGVLSDFLPRGTSAAAISEFSRSLPLSFSFVGVRLGGVLSERNSPGDTLESI